MACCRRAQTETDLEQALLEDGDKSDQVSSSTAQNGHARSEASEAMGSELEVASSANGANGANSAAQSVWRDPVLPATLAAVLCLWVLKLVQQGYVDGAFQAPHTPLT